jgi:hypothetical protein
MNNDRTSNMRPAKRSFVYAVLIGMAALLSGCMRAGVTTVVHADGTWTRETVYRGVEGQDQTTHVTDVFRLPAGNGWKVKKTSADNQLTYDAQKTFHPGQILEGDIAVKPMKGPGKGVPKVVNTAAIRPLGGGRFIYTETFHWVGTKPGELVKLDPKTVVAVKQSLPAPFAKGADVRALAVQVEQDTWHMLFAPPEPLLSEMWTEMPPLGEINPPELYERNMLRRLGKPLLNALHAHYGDRMTAEQRLETTRKLVHQIAARPDLEGTNGLVAGEPGKGKPKHDAAAMPSMDDVPQIAGLWPAAVSVSIRFPGRVIKTNGQIDTLTGEVYWTLFPQVAAQGDVTLSAVYIVEKQTAFRQ